MAFRSTSTGSRPPIREMDAEDPRGRRVASDEGGGLRMASWEDRKLPLPEVFPLSRFPSKFSTTEKPSIPYGAEGGGEEAAERSLRVSSSAVYEGAGGGGAGSGGERSIRRDRQAFAAFPPADSRSAKEGDQFSAPRQRLEDSLAEASVSTSVRLDRIPAVASGEAPVFDGPEVMDVTLVPCDCCGRRFAEDRVQRHRAMCEKQKKQGWMRQKPHRAAHALQQGRLRPPSIGGGSVGGVFGDHASSSREPYGGGGNAIGSPSSISSTRAKGKSDWRKQSLHLRGALNGVDLVEDDRVACPHCHRRFAEDTAVRHIPLCRERMDTKLHNFNS